MENWCEEQGRCEGCYQGQTGVQGHQENENHRHGDKVLCDITDTFGQGFAKQQEIAGRARHQRSGGAILKKHRGLDDEALEEQIPQVSDCRETKPRRCKPYKKRKEVFDQDRQ